MYDSIGYWTTFCYLDPKAKVKGKKVGICDGALSTATLVFLCVDTLHSSHKFFKSYLDFS